MGGIGVGGVQQELDGGGAFAGEIAGIVVGNDHAGVGAASADCVAELVDGGVVARRSKALALGQGGDQFAALGRAAVVDHGEANVGHRCAEREAEQRELQDRREDQRDLQPAVAPNLVELLLDQGAEAVVEQRFQKVSSGHAFTCIFLMPRQAKL